MELGLSGSSGPPQAFRALGLRGGRRLSTQPSHDPPVPPPRFHSRAAWPCKGHWIWVLEPEAPNPLLRFFSLNNGGTSLYHDQPRSLSLSSPQARPRNPRDAVL